MNFIYTVFGWPSRLDYVCVLFDCKKLWTCSDPVYHYYQSIAASLGDQAAKVHDENGHFKPQMDVLQRKYKNNREKLNEEMMKLYEKEHYNPMSGCLLL